MLRVLRLGKASESTKLAEALIIKMHRRFYLFGGWIRGPNEPNEPEKVDLDHILAYSIFPTR
jgi:hypothetical protein